MSTIEKDQLYIAGTYARFPVVITKGQGALLTDEQGREYIDLGSGIAVNVFGAADQEWVSAVCRQAGTLAHTSNLYYTSPQVALAENLTHMTGMKKVFFGNSGAEANECAIKAARKYGGQRHKIISLEGSFHGRTLATLSMTGQDAFHQQFHPLPEGFSYIPPNDIPALEKALCDESVCALTLEMVQGEGGVNPLDSAFAQRAQALCREKDILLMVDEVQTGLGRCAALYAYMRYGLKPDVVTSAKGLGGGLPIGACLLGDKVKDVFALSDHGSTFGGNPICCAGANAVLSRMDDALFDEVNQKSKYIFTALSGAPGVKSVTGLGLMLGIEAQKPGREVADSCLKNGVLVLTAKNKVRLLPPLNISWELLYQAMAVLKAALA